MDIEATSKQKLLTISEQMNVNLEIRKLWQDGNNPGFHFMFYGLLQDSPLLKIEIVGSYYFGIRKNKEVEEIDIFPFINGI